MKEIKLKQYIEVVRTVALEVPDNCDEVTAAKMLDEMPLHSQLPFHAYVTSDWKYVSDTGIENMDGKVILHEEEEDMDRE